MGCRKIWGAFTRYFHFYFYTNSNSIFDIHLNIHVFFINEQSIQASWWSIIQFKCKQNVSNRYMMMMIIIILREKAELWSCQWNWIPAFHAKYLNSNSFSCCKFVISLPPQRDGKLTQLRLTGGSSSNAKLSTLLLPPFNINNNEQWW